MNGIGQSAGELGRAVGPIAAAPLFSWSADNGRLWGGGRGYPDILQISLHGCL